MSLRGWQTLVPPTVHNRLSRSRPWERFAVGRIKKADAAVVIHPTISWLSQTVSIQLRQLSISTGVELPPDQPGTIVALLCRGISFCANMENPILSAS